MAGGITYNDPTSARRLALASLLALGLHAFLLLAIPPDWFSFHWRAPQRFDVVLLPPVDPLHIPGPSIAAPEPTPSAETPETSEIAQPAPSSPTILPPPVVRKTAPPTAPTIAKTAPSRPLVHPLVKPPKQAKTVLQTHPVQPAKPIAPPKSAAPLPKRTEPVASTQPTPRAKPLQPIASPTPVATHQPTAKISSRRSKRSTGTSGTAIVASNTRSSSLARLDSNALLGQIAALEMDKQRRANAGIRSKRIYPNDTQSLEGFYIAAWIRKVERIGENNFPDIARKLNLTTGPVLDVRIHADGSLGDVRIARSSGNAELDQAAQRIVRLGDPYAPFPPELRQKWDALQISRPWRFEAGGQFQAR